MNLLPLKDYVETNTDWVFGQSLFVSSMPAKVSRGVMIVSEFTGARVSTDMPGLYQNRFQVIVRATDYEQGQTDAIALFDLLFSRVPVDLGSGMVADWIIPMHRPIDYRRSDADQIEFSINYEIRYKILSP